MRDWEPKRLARGRKAAQAAAPLAWRPLPAYQRAHPGKGFNTSLGLRADLRGVEGLPTGAAGVGGEAARLAAAGDCDALSPWKLAQLDYGGVIHHKLPARQLQLGIRLEKVSAGLGCAEFASYVEPQKL